MSSPITLEVFSDYVCPWCYLASGRAERLVREFEIGVRLVHYPLHPRTPAEGMSLEELFAGRGYDMEAMYQRMKGLMEEEGLPYSRRTHTYNSRLAQELGTWAETQAGGGAIHAALYKAYFVDGVNIGEREVLVRIAGSVGLPEDEARAVLADRTFKAHVDADWEKSRAYEVTGVPSFVVQGMIMVGAQPYERLVKLVEKAGAARRG